MTPSYSTLAHIRILFAFLALTAALSGAAFAAGAAVHVVTPGSTTATSTAAPPPTITNTEELIVDNDRILHELLAVQDVQKQLDQQREKFQAELAKDETRLRDGEQKLTQERDTSSSEDYTKAQMKLRADIDAVDRKAQVRRHALDVAFSDAMQTIHGVLMQIVQDMAASRHAKLVLFRQQVLWSDSSLDITDSILAQMNKKMPSLAIKIPANPDALEPGSEDVPIMKFEGQ